MDIFDYENQLKSDMKNGIEQEEFWDKRAEAYYNERQSYEVETPGKVINILRDEGVLPCPSVLDIGGGTGHYAVPFMDYTNSITITDISGTMLSFAEEHRGNALFNKRSSDIKYKKLNWLTADLDELGWKKSFELVFSSMCPAVKTLVGLNKMIEASSKWCCISQYSKSIDTFEERILQALKTNDLQIARNDRSYLQTLFNILWLRGYNPTIRYINQEFHQDLTISLAKQRYERRYWRILKDYDISLDRLLNEQETNGFISIDGVSKLAVICWDINK